MMAAVIILFSWAMVFCGVHSQSSVCSKEWFGSRCQYKCRCTNNNCNENGMCTAGGKCQQGWFGPSCQYVDLAYEQQSVATDGDDNTCLNPYISTNTINLKLNLHWFTWMRIRLSNPDFLHHMTINFNGYPGLNCRNARNATVDETTLDIHCDLRTKVQYVTLKGEGVKHLCSIYISGGRNVALRQHTIQSSTYIKDGHPYSSSKSVDGNTNGDFYGGKSCSCTNENDLYMPNWNVSFSQSQKVYRYVLYNRQHELTQIRLQGFNLKSFDNAHKLVFYYKDQTSNVLPVYTVIPETTTSAISLVNIASKSDNLLQMCEVEAYGDSACDSGTFGRECAQTCNCVGDDECFISTGGCPAGCAVGFYGEMCNLLCKPGTYGLGCKNSCSLFCSYINSDKRSCDHFNGTCLRGCMSGYEGITCTSRCAPDTYGPMCGNHCSEFCLKDSNAERSCDHADGICLNGCKSGYQGPQCMLPCEHGRHGQDCNLNCSESCIDNGNTNVSTCHHVTGICTHGCHTDHDSPFCYSGPLSDSQISEKHKTGTVIGAAVSATLGVVIVVTSVALIAIVVRRRKGRNLTNQPTSSSELNLADISVIASEGNIYEAMTASSIGQSTHKIMNSSSMKRKDTLPCDNAINTQSHNNTSFEIMENDYMRENNISDSDAVIYEQTREENTYERLDNNSSNSENDVQTRCDGAEIDVSTSNKVNLKIEDELINENPIHFYEELNSEEPRISCAYLDIDNVPIIRNSTATYVEMSRSCSNIYENAELYSSNDINGMITHVSEEEIGSRSEVDYVNFKSAGI